MKTLGKFSIIILLSVLTTAESVYANTQNNTKNKTQTKQEKKEQRYIEVKSIVESKNFVFNTKRAFPTGGRSIDLYSNPGYITIKNDSAIGDLPYFGRSYTGIYDGNAGIHFNGLMQMKNLKLLTKRNTKIIYSFSIRHKHDHIPNIRPLREPPKDTCFCPTFTGKHKKHRFIPTGYFWDTEKEQPKKGYSLKKQTRDIL